MPRIPSDCCSRVMTRMLLAVLVATGLIALSPSAPTDAAVIVSVEPGPQTYDATRNQTRVTLTFKATLTGDAPAPTTPFDASGFGVSLEWTTSTPGVSVSNLYTVDSQGDPASGPSAMDLSNGIYNGLSAFADNVTLNGSNGINASFSIFDENDSPEISGTVTLAQVYFAVDVPAAVYTLQVLDTSTDPNSALFDTSLDSVSISGSSATLSVVPEPHTISGVIVACVAFGGWHVRRRQARRRTAA